MTLIGSCLLGYSTLLYLLTSNALKNYCSATPTLPHSTLHTLLRYPRSRKPRLIPPFLITLFTLWEDSAVASNELVRKEPIQSVMLWMLCSGLQSSPLSCLR